MVSLGIIGVFVLVLAALTFLGPLLGSLIRPFGGALADRFKGSVVTFFNFIAMAVGALIVLGASQINSLPIFIVGFVMLFIFSGVGNGSTYKMIPAIFHAKAQLEVGAGLNLAEADHRAIRRSGNRAPPFGLRFRRTTTRIARRLSMWLPLLVSCFAAATRPSGPFLRYRELDPLCCRS